MDQAAAPPAAIGEPVLHDLLITGPDVGDDADFERTCDPGRELLEWDSRQ
jgi:hypothetical protein